MAQIVDTQTPFTVIFFPRGTDKAWIDSSTGNGELETNDSDYVYDYLKMPEIVREISKDVSRIKQELAGTVGYRRYYDPTLSENN